MKFWILLIVGLLWCESISAKYTFPEGANVKTRSEEIAAYQMREYDQDKDGLLSLEEFESRFDNLTREDRRNIRRNKKKGTYKKQFVCTAEIWCECLGNDKAAMDRYKTRELSEILRSLQDWEFVVSTKNFPIYGKQKYYKRKNDLL